MLTIDRVGDATTLASELGTFLAALYACEPAGPPPGPHSFGRGGPVAQWDDSVSANIDSLRQLIDTRATRAVWAAAVAARRAARAVWVHGDVTGTNLLVQDGRLAGVVDFGCSAFGDPACDLTIA